MSNLADRIYKSSFLTFRRIFGAHVSHGETHQIAPLSLLPGHSCHARRDQHEALASRYGHRYRGGIVIGFSLGFMAVMFALLPLIGLWSEAVLNVWGNVFTGLEMLCIIAILFQHLYGRGTSHDASGFSRFLRKVGFKRINQGWRHRWSSERLFAEQYCYAELMLAFPGGPLQIDNKPVGNDASFLAWYAETLASQSPMPDDTDHRQAYGRFFMAMLDQQIDYHHQNTHVCHGIAHRLHHLADYCFWGTLLACAAHFVIHHPLLNVITALLPALAATCHGILAAGEFAKLSEHSDEMHAALLALKSRLQDEGATASLVSEFITGTVHEAAGWHFALSDKDMVKA